MAKLTINGATIYTPTERLKGHSLLVDGGKIHSIQESAPAGGSRGAQTLDATGLLIVPGFIDLQINGAFGHDFTASPKSIWEVSSLLVRYGVTSFLPTIITSPLETIAKAQAVLQTGRPPAHQGAEPLGLHVEGPFLNPERKGAHNGEYLRLPSLSDYANISQEQGVLLATLAPELSGAAEVIQALVRRGVTISAGHSQATYEGALAAFDQGVRYGTHLFNAMPPFTQFEPGLVGALLSDERPFVGLIADGIHVHSAAVKVIWRSAGPERLTLVTDAMAALGMPPGRYGIGDQEVHVDERSARLESGRLAGSILSMDSALRNLVSMTGCELTAALQTVSLNPARLLGLDEQVGRVAVGQRADLTLLTPQLEVALTICGGEISYRAPGLSNSA